MWIKYIEIKDLPLNNLKVFIIEKLNQNPDSNLFNLKISDLIFNNDNLMVNGVGIYIFIDSKEDNSVLYVGKCSSRHFVERISSHFDPRLNAWFNSFLKVLIKKDKTNTGNDKQELIITKLKEIFSNDGRFKICLIDVPESFDKKKIQKMEDILRFILEPLNKKNKGPQANLTLDCLLS